MMFDLAWVQNVDSAVRISINFYRTGWNRLFTNGGGEGIARARLLSHATMRNIRRSLFFAFVYNALGVPIAAGVLYPFFGLLLSPMIAAAVMSFS